VTDLLVMTVAVLNGYLQTVHYDGQNCASLIFDILTLVSHCSHHLASK